jgi:hypothetical protein
MPARYYPSFRIKTNQFTKGQDFILDGAPYSGPYYTTFSGQTFSGPDPITGPNQPLTPISNFTNSIPGLSLVDGSATLKQQLANSTKILSNKPKSLVSYFPNPIQSDYNLGYINRYFAKQINNKGYITEISPTQYTEIKNGDAGYDTSMLQTVSIAWKLTGPLNSVRISQYDTRAGIIDTNKRLVEAANPNFFGLVEFIGGNYSKFAKPTA